MAEVQIIETPATTFDLFAGLENTDHEQIVFCQDNATGLKAIIAIHNTVLGPGLGGTRMWMYAHEKDAIKDVLRLSRGMTYKASVAGLNLGGAKAVIIGDPKTQKSEPLMRKFGRFVNNLNGKYITAEDVGTTTRDMEYVKMETNHVVGLPEIMGGGGDPSPVTAYGTFVGIKASAKAAWGNDSLSGKSVAVLGIGKVGFHLVEYLSKEGATVYVSDINDKAIREVTSEHGAIPISGEDMLQLEVDVFAPCALGGVLNTKSINNLKCQIVAGAANNQLEDEQIHGDLIKSRGIYYAPDFVINAGGLINVYSEHTGYIREQAFAQTENIYNTILDIYKLSSEKNINTQMAAISMAEKRIKDMAAVHSTY